MKHDLQRQIMTKY